MAPARERFLIDTRTNAGGNSEKNPRPRDQDQGLVETAFAGDYHSVFKGRGMNFEDVREYQPGDEIRAIDWNVTARMGNAFVKKFTEERELTVMLVVDVSASGNFGSTTQSKRELAAEVACLARFQRHSKQRQGRADPLYRSR